MKNKKYIYRESCFKYGILSLLYLMDEYCEVENYEECQIILDSIKELNKKFDMDLPTIYNNAIKYFKDSRGQKHVDHHLRNKVMYSIEIKRKILSADHN